MSWGVDMVSLPYLHAQTSSKDLATHRSSPNVGMVGHHRSTGKLCPLTKDTSREHTTCKTIYVEAIGPTSSCSQDI